MTEAVPITGIHLAGHSNWVIACGQEEHAQSVLIGFYCLGNFSLQRGRKRQIVRAVI